uniref:Acyl-coenzyme A oxidase n=1 Tax=Saccoglossus kowalevskii TaxID=10224 RepID=A0ABM0GKC5_SACKO|nr:PREDICTED: peroxisomal acyl-coenzyme A oxidase 3-like [Saccoglossus kowalevskii]
MSVQLPHPCINAMPDKRTIDELIPDMPVGPIDKYRKSATFDWKQMKMFLEGEDCIRYQNEIWDLLEKDPLFARSVGTVSVNEMRMLVFQRVKRLSEYYFLTQEKLLENPMVYLWFFSAIGLYDWALPTKFLLSTQFFGGTIRSSGSKHHLDLADQSDRMELIGSFSLTELSHGSNVKNMRTTATFDPETKDFILNTPDIEATKIWMGNVGKTATHSIVYAQLYTADGKCHGLHMFVVQIRDTKTLLPLPGIMVGDIGHKLGLNGLDNGFLMFNNVRIPRQSLLNKTGDVTSAGKYTTPFLDPEKKFGASLGTLSGGRVGIVSVCAGNLKICVPIAIRYSAARKQFGPTNDKEIPVLEYQLQQWRLIPYLAAMYAIEIFSKQFMKYYLELNIGTLLKSDAVYLAELGKELHAVACSSKPLTSWLARDAIQECREACGGHGYLSVSRFGEIRGDNDANTTYEGDNNVILQQTSNYLLICRENKQNGVQITAPMKTVNFLNDADTILKWKFQATTAVQCYDAAIALAAYKWLVCYQLKESADKLNKESSSGKDGFEARNDSQAYFARSLALMFIEHTVLQWFYDCVNDPAVPPGLAPVLKKLCALYGLWSLEKHMATLYQGGYMSGRDPARLIREAIVQLCRILKDDAVALVDVIAPRDFILNSALGKADGEIYKNIFSSIMKTPKVMERPDWWREFCNKPVQDSLRGKL